MDGDRTTPRTNRRTHARLPIVVYCHLRWDWVYQRPQHIVSRLARGRRVLFVEEAGHGEQSGQRIQRVDERLTVLRPGRVGDEAFALASQDFLREAIAEGGSDAASGHIAWLYTPMALDLALAMQPSLVVYDCMDELSTFKHAPPQLREAEDRLFEKADLVFTGGPSLYRAKAERHPRVFCFPSSVDSAHFGAARKALEAPTDQADIPSPRLGFFGVIDERLDLELVRHVADARPDWQLVFVGPVTKIDPADLPRGNNVHYLGQKEYASLPAYLSGWDLCLLPFARNEATRFISPTKTLEYMAAEKPIVSTPIADVADLYSDIVHLGNDAESFTRACEQALSSDASDRTWRSNAMREVLARTSWNTTVASMEILMQEAIERAATPAVPAVRAAVSAARRPSVAYQTVVVGAGPTGLSAAYHLGKDCLLVERGPAVGGWCRSIRTNGFTFDYAGHIMFSNDPYVHEMYRTLLGDNVHWQDREAWIFSKSVHTRYPFQGALYGLPAEVIKECILGAVEARFGPVTARPEVPAAAAPGLKTTRAANGIGAPLRAAREVTDCCADGVLESTVACGIPMKGRRSSQASESFEDFIYNVWGAGIAKHFAIPYNRKLWAVPLSEMETSWLGGRVPMPDLGEMIEGALKPVPKPMGPNARFGYPLRGGFQALMDGFLPFVENQLRLQTEVTAVSPSRRTVTFQTGETVSFDTLISTMPLPQLIARLGDEAPATIRAAAARLRYVSVCCVHLGIGRERVTDKHWIYYPEDPVFHRIFVQGNASPHCNPPGGFGLTCEITYSPTKPLPAQGDALIDRCIADCRRVGLIREDDPIWARSICDLPYAYVVYDHARAESVGLIRAWLAERGILLAGRYSEWEYYNSDHAFLAGKKAAEAARAVQLAPGTRGVSRTIADSIA